LVPSLATGAVPLVVHHEGRLLDGEDKPLDGAFDLTFAFYSKASDAAGEDNLVWSQTYAGVVVAHGIYDVDIGAPDKGKALDPADWSGGERWLGIAVGGVELTPRLRVGSTLYALHATDAATVGGHAPSDFAAASHTHAAAEVTDFAVAVAAVDL